MALEVAAAIIGILAAAGKVAEVLAPVITAYGDSVRNAAIMHSEISNARFTLVSLHALFDNLSEAPQRRRKLIQVDQLIISLTDGVLLFSELEAFVTGLDCPSKSMSARIIWAWKDDQMALLVSRMQRFQISMSLMLNILQCISETEAQWDRKELLSITTALLESNLELTTRISHLEEDFHTVVGKSRCTSRPGSLLATENSASISASRLLEELRRHSSPAQMETTSVAQYESDLETSRVYRKVRRMSSLFSFRSSIAQTHAWTALSDVSLSEISIMSVVALPLRRDDIGNQHHYIIQRSPEICYSHNEMGIANGKAVDRGPRKIKIVVKGTKEAEINKLVAKFIGPPSVPRSEGNIINCYEKMYDVDGVAIHLEIQAITDTHGIDIDRHLRNAQNYISVSSMRSLDSDFRSRKDKLRIEQWQNGAFYTHIFVGNHFRPNIVEGHPEYFDGVVYSNPSRCYISKTDTSSIDVAFRAIIAERLRYEDSAPAPAPAPIAKRKSRLNNILGIIEE